MGHIAQQNTASASTIHAQNAISRGSYFLFTLLLQQNRYGGASDECADECCSIQNAVGFAAP